MAVRKSTPPNIIPKFDLPELAAVAFAEFVATFLKLLYALVKIFELLLAFPFLFVKGMRLFAEGMAEFTAFVAFVAAVFTAFAVFDASEFTAATVDAAAVFTAPRAEFAAL
jgi:hypothetical protein